MKGDNRKTMQTKIKLVAFDMDGTVLNSRLELPQGLFSLIEKHTDIKFVVASGRQYYSLLKIFEPVADRMIFIAENGSIIMEKGRALHINPIKPCHVSDVLERVRDNPDIYPVLGCEKTAYVENAPKDVLDDIRPYNARLDIVDNIDSVIGIDNVLNFALYSYKKASENIMPRLNNISPEIKAVLSAESWVDVINVNVNKGSAIKIIQDLYGINKEECAAFGDYMNDYELLQSCGESYAMENAHEELKKYAKYIAPSNDDEGVVQVLKKIL